jgi:hypothetical protein
MRRSDRALARWAALLGVVTALAGFAATAAASPAEDKRKKLLEQLGITDAPEAPAPAEPAEPPEPTPAPEPDSPAPVDPPSSGKAPGDGGTESPSPEPAVTYAGRIHRILKTSCSSCHHAGASAGGTKLVLRGEVGHDYRAAKKLVNTKAPDKSSLLTKAAGVAHLGGAPLRKGSSGYKAMRAWIAAGAPRDASSVAPAPVAPVPVAPPGTSSTPEPPTAPGAKRRPRKASRKKTGNAASPPVASEPTPVAEPPAAESPHASALEPARAPATTPPSTAAPVPAPPAFAPDAHAVLMERCASCHGTGKLASGGKLVLGGNVVADFDTAVPLVNVDDPDASPLLRKASGHEHGGGATLPAGSDGYRVLVRWIEAGAHGPTAADISLPATAEAPATEGSPSSTPVPEVDATTGASPPPSAASRLGDGTPLGAQTSAPSRLPFGLPFHLHLNGKLDFSYERRGWKNHPFQGGGTNAFQTYHHFLFLSRAGADDPFGFNVELVTQSFYEFNARIAPRRKRYDFLFKAGKILVPFGNEPLFHKSYGGRAGFDQEILPVIWAQPGIAASAHVRVGPVAISDDLYTVQGYALREADAVINLQNDVSTIDGFKAAFGNRLGLGYGPLTGWYSTQVNRLGFDRLLLMQAVDLELWRIPDVPVMKNLVFGLGGMRADVSGGGPGRDYYHFGSYAQIGWYPVQFLYLQYRAGLRTTDNRRGAWIDRTRLDERDRSSHNVSIVGRYKGFYAGLQLFWNLEKANEQDDDFMRVTVGFEF